MPFLLHHAHGFDQYVLVNAYKSEKHDFLLHIEVVNRQQVQQNEKVANIIRIHVNYKIKDYDEGYFKLMTRIAPHENEDAERDNMPLDCSMCSSCWNQINIMHSISSRLA